MLERRLLGVEAILRRAGFAMAMFLIPALMLARLGAVLTARLANAPLLPYDLARPYSDMARHLAELEGTKGGQKSLLGSLRARALHAAERAGK